MKSPGIYYFVLLVLFSLASMTQRKHPITEPAKTFTLKNVDGQMVSLSDFTNGKKGAIIVFTCNHCPFAKKYEARIIDLDKKFAPKGFPVIAINPNDPVAEPEDSFDEMVKRAKEKNYPFPYLIDETQEIAKAYGAAHTPHVFVVVRKGNSFFVEYEGGIDDNINNIEKVKSRYVENAIAEIIEGKPVSNPQTRAIGCAIKWK